MKYNYDSIAEDLRAFLETSDEEFYYLPTLSKEFGVSVYVLEKALQKIQTDKIIRSQKGTIYMYLDDAEKQVPPQFVLKMEQRGWKHGRCEKSRRAISIAEGGDPDAEKLVPVNKDKKTIFVTNDELSNYLSEGWSKGRCNLGTSGKLAIYKNNVEKYVSEDELIVYMSQGWSRGGKPKQGLRDYSHVWNKGVTKDTDPRLQSVAEKIRNYNLNMPQEKKDRISAAVHKLWLDVDYRQNQVEKRQGRIAWNKGLTGIYHWSDAQRDKCFETKRRNKTFNTSKPEEHYYAYLVTLYGEDNVIRQYKEYRYPFCCDFYIPSDDLFIELNLHWTHGQEPFNANNPNHIQLLNTWEERAHTSDFYKVAIYVWTELDVLKKQTAIKNNLNYEVIYEFNTD